MTGRSLRLTTMLTVAVLTGSEDHGAQHREPGLSQQASGSVRGGWIQIRTEGHTGCALDSPYSFFFHAGSKALVRRLVHPFADWQHSWMDHADGWMGRRLWGTFNSSGLFDGAVHARVLINNVFALPWYGHARAQDFRGLVKRGFASAEDYDRFIAEQEALSDEGRYFYSICGYAYVGRRRMA